MSYIPRWRNFILLLLIAAIPVLIGGGDAFSDKRLSSEEEDYLAEKREIVFIETRYPPFEFINRNGEFDGMTIELIRWMGAELGFRARFVHRTLEEARRDVLRDNADVIISLFYSDERDRVFDFSDPIVRIPARIFVRADRTDIKDIDDLNGKIVAIPGGDYANEFIRGAGIGCAIATAPNFAETITMVRNNVADAMIGDEQVVLYNLYSSGTFKQFKCVGEPLYMGISCFGLKEGNDVVKSILNRGLRKARESGTLDAITVKWFGTVYDVPESVLARYYGVIIALMCFAVFFILLLWYWNYQLKRQVALRTSQLLHEMRKTADSESMLRTIFDSAHDAIIIHDLATDRIVEANASASHMYGYAPGEILNRTIHDLGCDDPPYSHADSAAMISVARKKGGLTFEWRAKKKDGALFWAEVNLTFAEIRGRDAAVALIRDISVRKQFEEEQQKVLKLQSLGILAGGIAHDFNNIMTAILGNLSLAKLEMPVSNPIYSMLDQAENATWQVQRLTQQLLTFAKGGNPVCETSTIPEVIRESAGFVLRGSAVRVEYDFPGNLFPVNIDRGQMSQVFQNLVLNAKQSMNGGGVVTISAANVSLSEVPYFPRKNDRHDDFIRISIADMGSGIPQSVMSNIFDPYFTTRKDGSGLGLSIVHSIVSKHDGSITVDSREGGGTTFHVYLPAAAELFKAAVKKEAVDLRGSGSVLVMDDEDAIRAFASRTLRGLGYSADAAGDGASACDMYDAAMKKNAPFDIVILDVTVPGGMGGVAALNFLKERDPGVRAIVSSGYSNDPVMWKYDEYGFIDVLPKPYTAESLGRIIKKHIC